jgi:hypothetical protein
MEILGRRRDGRPSVASLVPGGNALEFLYYRADSPDPDQVRRLTAGKATRAPAGFKRDGPPGQNSVGGTARPWTNAHRFVMIEEARRSSPRRPEPWAEQATS